MGRRSDVERLCQAVERAPEQKMLKRAAADELGWTAEKLERVIDRSGSEHRPLLRLRGGKSIRYLGNESRGGTDGVGKYLVVQAVITKYWAPRNHLQECVVLPTARTRLRDGGVWRRPDLVMYAHPRRREHRDDARLAHAIEVESAGGFSIASVYQAHAEGHGAEFSWVLFQKQVRDTDAIADWGRIEWAARKLGVGLLGFTNSNAVGTWQLHRAAERRRPSRTSRREFRSWFPEPDGGRP